MRSPRLLLLLWLLALAPVVATAGDDAAPELILHHGQIVTVDDRFSVVPAMAVKAGRIVRVGGNRDVLALAGPRTERIDLRGKMVLPGLIDSHTHPTAASMTEFDHPIPEMQSIADVLAYIRERAKVVPEGEWIQVRQVFITRLREQRYPTRAELDAAAPRHPVVFSTGPDAALNTLALRESGMERGFTPPDGGAGYLELDPTSGEPTGILSESAAELIARAAPPPTVDQVAAAVREAQPLAWAAGLTGIHEINDTDEMMALRAFQVLRRAGELGLRVVQNIPAALLETYARAGIESGFGDEWIRIGGVKFFMDGALGSRTAAMLQPYEGEPDNRGVTVIEPEEMQERARLASRAGLSLSVHAIGDRANRIVLDIFERVQREVPGARDLRLRVEHAQILDQADIPRFARLGVIASMQATHATSDMPWAPTRLGPERTAEGAYVWRKLLDTGAIIANGSDFPVEEANPMLGLYAAVTRQDPSGQPPGGWMPDQRMTREEALASFTIHAAYAAHLERELGSLEPGKLADLVVLSKDVMTVPPPEILTTRVLYTIVGGRIVHEAAAGSARAGRGRAGR